MSLHSPVYRKLARNSDVKAGSKMHKPEKDGFPKEEGTLRDAVVKIENGNVTHFLR